MGAKDNGMEVYLENKVVYSVYDNGYFYSFRMKTYDTKEEAISYWEELTHKSYDKYDEYVKNAYHGDGHWYYGIEEENLGEYFNKREKQAIKDAIYEKKMEIREEGNKQIEFVATEKEGYRIMDIMSGLYYYLESAIGYRIDEDKYDRKRRFEETLKKYNIT